MPTEAKAPDPIMDSNLRPEICELKPEQGGAARDLVLRILNEEYRLALTLEELPDLVDVVLDRA